VVGSLDEKTDLNREMNWTLEAITQAIFQSWFVDFDPVVAKADRREPFGMDVETAALFPDRFVDSELGPIPEDWDVCAMESIVELHRNSIKPFEHTSEVFAHYSIPAFDTDQRPVLESGHQIKSGKYLVPDPSVLVSKLNPTSPRVWYVGPGAATRAVASTEYLVLTPLGDTSFEFLVCQQKDPGFQRELAALATGTTGSRQRVKPTSFQRMRIVKPPFTVDRRFASVVQPMLDLITENREEAQTLAELRDLLLPKLLSGEIRIPEAKEIVEDTA
jgi:type I restriction enzyme S subunit